VCYLFAGETCPQNCSPATAVVLSHVYTAVTRQQCIHVTILSNLCHYVGTTEAHKFRRLNVEVNHASLTKEQPGVTEQIMAYITFFIVFHFSSVFVGSRDCLVGTATIYGLDDRDSIPDRDKGYFSSSQRPALGPTLSPYNRYRRCFS
jgi:hypothetical protein